MSQAAHLVRRFLGSWSKRVPDDALAARHLNAAELALWRRLAPADQRHALQVAERLLAAHPDAPRHEIAAALLHDIGKLDSGLGTLRRVAATLVVSGDRSRRYHDHERLGAAMLRSVGSDERTVAIVAGEPSPERHRIDAADDV
jgi:putative nucleotidyltransferase with HDIG domain